MIKINKGFTLAELMVVLAVLGVIAAILTPVLFDSMPDENRVKFRKAQYTLQKAMEQTLNSETYDTTSRTLDKDEASTDETLFCKTFADQLNTIGAITCTSAAATSTKTQRVTTINDTSLGNFDAYCGANSPATVAFRTQDGVTWWGGIHSFYFNPVTTTSGIEDTYITMCLDVDGGGAESPFGFGVRRDGKILMGKKATDWIQADIRDAIDNR